MSTTLSEAESRRLVARHGVPVSPFVTGTSTDEVVAAVDADATVTYPVVAKLCGRAIAHKTERGLVRLRITDEAGLRTACDELLAAARPPPHTVAPPSGGVRRFPVTDGVRHL